MMMMKSVIWWRKLEYPEETTDLRQVTDETEVYRSNSLKLYTKIRYGLVIMHVKQIFYIKSI